MSASQPQRGPVLFYLIGPSGAGKDSLAAYARERLGDNGPVFFAPRDVTRNPTNGVFDQSVDWPTFEARRSHGAYALHWEAHDNGYGVPTRIDAELAAGRNVLVSGSRYAMDDAMDRYRNLVAVYIRATVETRTERLVKRSREDRAGIRARLERQEPPRLEVPDLVFIDNDGALEVAGDRMVTLLRGAALAKPSRISG